MLHQLMGRLDRAISFNTASAHCDIPCKIYDPSGAQIAVLTIIRMMDLIQELADKGTLSIADQAQLARLVAQKEEHVQKVKNEIRIIWGDFFKQPQFDQIPNAHELTHNIMLQASKCSQHIDRPMGVALLALVNEFAEAFWKVKGVATYSATCPYPPAETVVYPKLG